MANPDLKINPRELTIEQDQVMRAGYEEVGRDAAQVVIQGFKPVSWLRGLVKGLYPAYCVDHWLLLASKEK